MVVRSTCSSSTPGLSGREWRALLPACWEKMDDIDGHLGRHDCCVKWLSFFTSLVSLFLLPFPSWKHVFLPPLMKRCPLSNEKRTLRALQKMRRRHQGSSKSLWRTPFPRYYPILPFWFRGPFHKSTTAISVAKKSSVAKIQGELRNLYFWYFTFTHEIEKAF